MSWWSMITTKGRLLTSFCLVYTQDEIRISGLVLEEGEEPAILIDRYHNKARIYRPFDECQALAYRHQYELLIRRHPEDTFISHIEKVLSLKHPDAQKPSPPENGELGLGTGSTSLFPEELVPEQMPNDLHKD